MAGDSAADISAKVFVTGNNVKLPLGMVRRYSGLFSIPERVFPLFINVKKLVGCKKNFVLIVFLIHCPVLYVMVVYRGRPTAAGGQLRDAEVV